MDVLKQLIEHVDEVNIQGQQIKLKLPSCVAKTNIAIRAMDIPVERKREDTGKYATIWNEICVMALKATVMNADDMTDENWEQLVSMTNEDSNKASSVKELLNKSLALCGLETDDEQKSDKLDEVSESLGKPLS